MKVVDSSGRYEAELLHEASRGDRFDETVQRKLVLRDLATGQVLLTRCLVES